MADDTRERTLAVLEALRDGQARQIAMQTEALELQRANFELVKEQFQRASALQERAEKMQNSGAQLMATARRSVTVVIPIILLLLAAVGWLIYRLF